MIDVKTLSSFDNFFFYGKNDLSTELESDLMQTLMQPKRSMLYNRRFGAGISERENYPNAISLQVMLRFDVANAIAYRNTFTTDGSDGTVDRRIAASQFSVEFIRAGGELDIRVYYFSYANTKKVQVLNVPTGGIS